MKTKNHLIAIQTLTDNHLESFIRCPYKFYNQYILRKSSGEVKWRQVVQLSVSKIIRDYYRLPLDEQNKLNLLKLIDQYWESLSPRLFENKVHYYIILAKITDHLLLFLTSEKWEQPPLFLYERLQTSVDEIRTKISLTIDFAEWSQHTFSIKKYLLDADEKMVKLYKYLIVIFSKKAFGVLPDTIELLSLFDGKRYLFYPTELDVAKGLNYLELVKNQIENPNRYSKRNCHHHCSECTYQVQQTNKLDIPLKTVMH